MGLVDDCNELFGSEDLYEGELSLKIKFFLTSKSAKIGAIGNASCN